MCIFNDQTSFAVHVFRKLRDFYSIQAKLKYVHLKLQMIKHYISLHENADDMMHY